MANPQPAESSQAQSGGLKAQVLSLDSRFWIVNVMEMFERLAYYGVRTVLPLYMVLSIAKGGPEFNHIQKGVIYFWWAIVQSFLPVVMGGLADRYGHKNTIVVAILLKIAGYIVMAQTVSFGPFLVGCLLLAAGTAIFKPGVQGTLAFVLKRNNASLGWGLFYQLVNVGGFLGPVLAGVLRLMDWDWVFYSCAIIVSINFLWLPFYREPTEEIEDAKDKPMLSVLWSTLVNFFTPRVFFFCLLFSGFWLLFFQFFDLLPNVIEDWVDSSDIIGVLGGAFSGWFFPTLVALILGVLIAIACGALVFLSQRPDQRAASGVSGPAYIVTGIGVFLAMLALNDYTAGDLVFAFVVAVIVAWLLYRTRINGYVAAGVTFGLAALAWFYAMRHNLVTIAPTLTTMAQEGKQINPEWLVNLNPALIIFLMVPVAYLTSFVKPMTSILVGMVVATFGAWLAGSATVGFICVAGIFVFSLGEMFSSPKKNEYLATLAKKGQEGMFMGYANFPQAIGWGVGSLLAGRMYESGGDKVNLARRFFLEKQTGLEFPEYYRGIDVFNPPQVLLDVHAVPKDDVVATLGQQLGMTAQHYQDTLFETFRPDQIWLFIAGIGVASLIGMVIYNAVIRRADRNA